MANAKEWAGRVGEWRESGLTARDFCEGKPYSLGGLRHWSYRLRKLERAARDPVVRLGRVLRTPTLGGATEVVGASAVVPAKTQEPMTRVVPPAPVAPTRAVRPDALVVECGAVRVAVRPGFDRETLEAVLDVLETRAGGAR